MDCGIKEKKFDDFERHKLNSGDREHGGVLKKKEKDWENIAKRLYLSAGHIALILG